MTLTETILWYVFGGLTLAGLYAMAGYCALQLILSIVRIFHESRN